MKKIIFIVFCVFQLNIHAQEAQLATQYFNNGEFKKAASLYETLYIKHTYNTTYLKNLADCYQQLEKYDEAEKLISNHLLNYPNNTYLNVVLGYNYVLQHLDEKANTFFEKAIKLIDEVPSAGYNTGKTFQDYHLLDYAISAYKKAMEVNPNANYNFQIAFIYGEKSETENMFNTYLDLAEENLNYFATVKNQLGKYVNDDEENENNILLKKLLIKRSVNNPQNVWNHFLSWLFVQQKDYDKAFIQEKAIYKRNQADLKNIINLGKIAFENTDFETTQQAFNFVIENTNDVETVLTAKLYLLEILIKTNADTHIIENKFQELFTDYGITKNTSTIQAIYAEFLAYKKNEPEKGISVLKEALKLPVNEFQKGYLKTKLGDILLFSNKFSSALIYYTQVQNDLKNHSIGQTARFKIAQTSYFKGDFDWAQSQLKVLKNSTSQLIANDALDLNLLITDNAVKDSLKTPLKKYAKADFLAFQNKNEQAIDTLQTVITLFKEHPIIDEALYKQAKLFEKLNNFEKAESNYLEIIKINPQDILVDDAIYYLAELYANQLNDTEKAKEYYQKIIFNYPSSIYLVDARKKFRKLRGDLIN